MKIALTAYNNVYDSCPVAKHFWLSFQSKSKAHRLSRIIYRTYHLLKKTVESKNNILTILLTLFLSTAWGQTELTVNFRINDDVSKTNDFRFSILTPKDTVIVFNSLTGSDFKKNRIELPISSDSLQGLFEYRTRMDNWKTVQYLFDSDTTELKRIEIDLYFSVNDSKTEFLQVTCYLSIIIGLIQYTILRMKSSL